MTATDMKKEKEMETCLKANCTYSRVQVVIVSLLILGASACAGMLAYSFLRNGEISEFETEYENNADRMHQDIFESLVQKYLTLQSVAALAGFNCPNSHDWPNCTIQTGAYYNLVDPMVEDQV